VQQDLHQDEFSHGAYRRRVLSRNDRNMWRS
jgi:hypothetical protein